MNPVNTVSHGRNKSQEGKGTAFDSLQLVFGQLDDLSLSVVVSVEFSHGFEVS